MPMPNVSVAVNGSVLRADVLVPPSNLSEETQRRLLIRLNSQHGEFNVRCGGEYDPYESHFIRRTTRAVSVGCKIRITPHFPPNYLPALHYMGGVLNMLTDAGLLQASLSDFLAIPLAQITLETSAAVIIYVHVWSQRLTCAYRLHDMIQPIDNPRLLEFP